MKILFCPAHYIYDEYHGGSEQHATYSIVHRIASMFPDSVVVTGKKLIRAQPSYQIVEVMPHMEGRDMSPIRAIWFTLAYTLAEWRLLRRETFDVIHHVRPFHIGTTFSPMLLLGLNRGIPVIVGAFAASYETPDQIHSTGLLGALRHAVETSILRLVKPLLVSLSQQTLRKASAVIVYDERAKTQVADFAGEANVIVIPPGKDMSRYQRAQKGHETHPTFEILSVGYLIDRKGVDRLIRAISSLRSDLPEARLTIVGDGPKRADLENLVRELGLGRYVRFAGFVEHGAIASYYRNAHVLVHLAHRESFGQIFLEAMASRLPIIASKTHGAEAVLRNGETALILDDCTPKIVAGAICKMARDPALQSYLAENAYRQFLCTYELSSVIIPRYLSLYSELRYSSS